MTDFLGDVSNVNETLATVVDIFDDMIEPVEDIRDEVKEKGYTYVTYIYAVVFVPFAGHLVAAFTGHLASFRCGWNADRA